MSTLAEAILAASARSLSVTVQAEVANAIGVLGPEAQRQVADLAPERRVFLADQFVRNLRSLAVDRAVEIEREIFQAVGAQPTQVRQLVLMGPHSILELRNHMKLALTALGLQWSAIARLQASVCMLATWIEQNGGGTMVITTGAQSVRFRVVTAALGGDATLLDGSPIVGALRQQVKSAEATANGAEVALVFTVTLNP